MAKFNATLPTAILDDVNFLERNAIDIFKGMTKAGAKVAAANMKANATRAFRGNTAAKMNAKLKITKPYETKKREITTAARYYGYIPKKGGGQFYLSQKGRKNGPYPGIPTKLLGNLAEYGVRSRAMPRQLRAYWDGHKHPFVRPAFSDTNGITSAMLKAQKELSKGLLQ